MILHLVILSLFGHLTVATTDITVTTAATLVCYLDFINKTTLHTSWNIFGSRSAATHSPSTWSGPTANTPKTNFAKTQTTLSRCPGQVVSAGQRKKILKKLKQTQKVSLK